MLPSNVNLNKFEQSVQGFNNQLRVAQDFDGVGVKYDWLAPKPAPNVLATTRAPKPDPLAPPALKAITPPALKVIAPPAMKIVAPPALKAVGTPKVVAKPIPPASNAFTAAPKAFTPRSAFTKLPIKVFAKPETKVVAPKTDSAVLVKCSTDTHGSAKLLIGSSIVSAGIGYSMLA